MKLDKRIKEGKRPLTCFDLKETEQFIGKKGYFAHCIDYYEDLKSTVFGTLGGTEDTDHSSFVCTEETFDNYYYHFFIPEDWVLPEEEPEKKYRPYSLNEFLNEHEIGDKITYRHKYKEQPENFIRHKEMICGYQIMEGEANTPGEGLINLGGTWVSLQAMFDDCETPNSYLYPEVWQPFGIKE